VVSFDYAVDKGARLATGADVTLRLHHALQATAPGRAARHGLRPSTGRWCRSSPPWRCRHQGRSRRLKRLSGDFAERLAELSDPLAGHEFNIGSPSGWAVLPTSWPAGPESGKTGLPPAPTCWDAAGQGHDLPARVLDWRQLSKLKSTYADALVEEINPETGRVHTSFALAATSTGRLSSTDPNLQNIPVRTEEGRKIRRAFIAEKGHKLLSVDYSQIEPPAHVAENAALKAFRAALTFTR
jgi:DNA polymerase-1